MNKLITSLILITSLASCAQKNNPAETYLDIAKTFCDCVNKDTLASATGLGDSCLKVSLQNNYKKIQQNGLDTSSSNPLFYKEVANEIQKNCPTYRQRVEKEVKELQDLKLKEYQGFQKTNFMGVFISQKKLSNGEYEIIIKSNADSMIFISKDSLNESEATKDGVQVSIAFEPNTTSLQTKYKFRAKSISILGMIKVGD